MPSSFFSSIQGLLKDRATGRYLGQLVAAMVEHHPEPIRCFINEATSGAIHWTKGAPVFAKCEDALGDKDDRSRSDVTITVPGSARVLVEIKFDDNLIERKKGDQIQLKRYLKHCKQKGLFLLVLTKKPLRARDRLLLEDYSSRAAHRFHAALGPHLERDGELASKFLLDYLKEIGLIMQPVNSEQLGLFLRRLLKPRAGGRKVAIKDLRDGPQQLSALMHNMALISDEFSPILCRKDSMRRSGATINLSCTPELDRLQLEKAAAASTGKLLEVDDKHRRGGQMMVSASHRLGEETGGQATYLRYGVLLDVKPDSEALSISTYAELDCPSLDRYRKEEDDDWVGYQERTSTRFLTKLELEKGQRVEEFASLATKALKEVLKRKAVKDAKVRRRLKEALDAIETRSR